MRKSTTGNELFTLMNHPASESSQSWELSRQALIAMLEVLESEECTLEDRRHAVCLIRETLGLSEEDPDSVCRGESPTACESDSQQAKFAEKLKELMKSRAITQEQLALRVGCSQPAISQLLKRQCRPQRNTILSLAAALNVDPRELWPDLEVAEILDTVAAVHEDREMSLDEAEALRRALEGDSNKMPTKPLPSRKT